jgi:hypothetical protein
MKSKLSTYLNFFWPSLFLKSEINCGGGERKKRETNKWETDGWMDE